MEGLSAPLGPPPLTFLPSKAVSDAGNDGLTPSQVSDLGKEIHFPTPLPLPRNTSATFIVSCVEYNFVFVNRGLSSS